MAESDRQLSEDCFYTVILQLVQEAGSIIREVFNRRESVGIMTKASEIDLVTETDRRVEKLLITGLKEQFPHHRFIGEESAAEHGEKNVLTDDPTWIIDPIDGTTNFVHKFPFVCVSVALYVNRRPCIGIVYNPVLDELFTARAGQGAFKNGFPIHCSGNKELNKAVVILTLGLHNLSYRKDSLDIYLENSRRVVRHGIRGSRCLGSAALNMCYIAQGSADGLFEYGIHCWDMAAAGLIVLEAGGCVLDPSGSAFDVMSRRVMCASSKELALQLTGLIDHVELPRDD